MVENQPEEQNLSAAATTPGHVVKGVAVVRTVEWRTKRLVRLTLHDDAIADMDPSRSPARGVKLFIPAPGAAVSLPVAVAADGPVYPEDQTPSIARSYTIRALDTDAALLTVEVGIHTSGPASTWASTVQPGDTVGYSGPRHFPGLPRGGPFVLLGDESALPALATVREAVAGEAVTTVVEVRDADDCLDLGPGDSPIWLFRNGQPPGSAGLLLQWLYDNVSTLNGATVWAATEVAEARAIRTACLTEWGLDADRLRISGHWRAGLTNTLLDNAMFAKIQEATANDRDPSFVDELSVE